MSIEAVTWALRVPVGGNLKVMLLGLANHAHPDGSEAYPTLDTLAEYGACDRSTARRNVRKLVAEGWAIEDGLGPRGQTKYRLALGRTAAKRGGGESPPVADEPAGGGAGAAEGVAPVPPEPSLGTVQNRTKTSDAREHVPDGFPEDLRPQAREVMRVLRAVAEQHGARKVWPQAVGRVVMSYPRHPLVATAHALAAWAVDPPRPLRDVVATYRQFLERERELAAPERLDGNGAVMRNGAAVPGSVVPLRRGRPTPEDYLRAGEALAREQGA